MRVFLRMNQEIRLFIKVFLRILLVNFQSIFSQKKLCSIYLKVHFYSNQYNRLSSSDELLTAVTDCKTL